MENAIEKNNVCLKKESGEVGKGRKKGLEQMEEPENANVAYSPFFSFDEISISKNGGRRSKPCLLGELIRLTSANIQPIIAHDIHFPANY